MHAYRIKRGPGYLSRYRDSLRAGRSGDRNPVGAKFSAPVQTGPGAHPASYTMGTGSFPGVKRSGCGVDYPTLSSAEVKERVELYLFSPSGPSWPLLGWPLPLHFIALNDIYLVALTVSLHNRQWIIYWICFGCVKEKKRRTKHKEKEERNIKIENMTK